MVQVTDRHRSLKKKKKNSVECSRTSPAKFTCPKSTIETLEKGVKYVQS